MYFQHVTLSTFSLIWLFFNCTVLFKGRILQFCAESAVKPNQSISQSTEMKMGLRWQAELKNKQVQEMNRFMHYYSRFKNHENSYKVRNHSFSSARECMIVRPLQFFCHILHLSYVIDQRRLLFRRSLHKSGNIVLRTLAYLNQNQFIAIAWKYGIVNYSSDVKTAILRCFSTYVF